MAMSGAKVFVRAPFGVDPVILVLYLALALPFSEGLNMASDA